MKYIYLLIVLVFFIAFNGNTAFGYCLRCSQGNTVQDLVNKSLEVYICGEQLNCDVIPQIVNQSVFVPARATLEKLGYKTVWDSSNMIATFTDSNNNSIQIKSGDQTVTINNSKYTLSDQTIVKDGRLLITSNIFDTLGYWQQWNPDTLILNINKYEW